MSYGDKGNREMKIVVVIAVGLLVIAICGYFLWLFHTIDFLPFWLNIIVRVLLVIFGLSTLTITVVQVKGYWSG